jgi:hypothetical protein
MRRCREWLTTTIIATILTLLAACSTYEEYKGPTGEVDILYLWSLVRHGSRAIDSDLSIRGTIVANDKLNELNNSIVVADKSGGIEIAIQCDDIDSHLPLFSDVEVTLAGLNIGRVGSKCVVGHRPSGEYVVDRIDQRDIYLYIKPIGLPHSTPAKHLSISEIDMSHMLNYVCVENVRFIDEEQGLLWCERDTVTHRYVTTLRHLTDGIDTLRVVTDKECRYASAPLPSGDITCYGIIDYYNRDVALRISDNQVL